MALVQLPDGKSHAVLTAVTSQGDYVLDNLTPAVLPWNNTNLVWIARQAPGEIAWDRIAAQPEVARAMPAAMDIR